MKRKLFNQSLRTTLLAAMCLISLSFVSCGGDDDDEESSEESANYVDLGLSVYWAKCNVGASKKSDYGYYFAWAETETKDDYNYDSSVSFMENISDFSGSYLYDAARVNLGGKWRTPTLEEFEELIENCTWYWSKNSGVSGYLVEGKNGNTIFLPAAGFMSEGNINYRGGNTCYWTSTPYINTEYSVESLNYTYAYMFIGNDEEYWSNQFFRYYGLTIRPVMSK